MVRRTVRDEMRSRMAKGKHAAALFEVISKGKGFEKRPPIAAAPPVPLPVAKAIEPAPQPAPEIKPAKPKVKVDSDRQEVSFKLSYTAAMVGVFAVIVLVAMIVVAMRQPKPVISPLSSEQLQKMPA